MKQESIICPQCKNDIPLTEAITHKIQAELKAKFESDFAVKEKEFSDRERGLLSREKELSKTKEALDVEVERRVKLEKENLTQELRGKISQEMALEVASLNEEIQSKNKKLQDAQKLEIDLRRQKTALEEQKQTLELDVARQVDKAKIKIYEEASKKIKEEMGTEVLSLRAEIDAKDERLQQAQALEVELRKQKSSLEDRTRSLELEVIRKVDEAKSKIYEEALKKANEDNVLKDREQEKLVHDLTTQVEILKKKIEQGSQQTQGEILELVLEDILGSAFPVDNIGPVPKGIKGADVIQTINNSVGQNCGSIIWESKRTKNWSDSWIDKLKEDQREVGAEIAILLTTVLPKNLKNFGVINGIWVTDYSSLIGLATSIRLNLIQVASIKQSIVGQNEKMEAMYHYFSGPEFKQKVEAIVEAFVAMQKDLNAEKRAMEKIWSKREKQIDRVIKNTIRMYGDLQGIVGTALPQIKILELTTISNEVSENELVQEEV